MTYEDVFEEYDELTAFLNAQSTLDGELTIPAEHLLARKGVAVEKAQNRTSGEMGQIVASPRVKNGEIYWFTGFKYLECVSCYFDLNVGKWKLSAFNIIDSDIPDNSDMFVGCSLNTTTMEILRANTRREQKVLRKDLKTILPMC